MQVGNRWVRVTSPDDFHDAVARVGAILVCTRIFTVVLVIFDVLALG